MHARIDGGKATLLTRGGLETLAPSVVALARAEGLRAHAESIEVRLR